MKMLSDHGLPGKYLKSKDKELSETKELFIRLGVWDIVFLQLISDTAVSTIHVI